ncbi:Histidine kinase [Gaiella occulta]|uniref:histidine kinase n=1 Tax=Gaiella occulta TaxID=1002870 RepID=A0A7M2YUR6_9ACTN|nr:histidine kinase [Gaiella occulta]RDI73882.1 Histidine kinase [Gaiella occulta]
MSDDGAAERLRAERDERRRLGELIHDGPVQQLAALAQMLDAARQALAAGDGEAADRIAARALEVSREASVDLREIVSSIEPEALRREGFAAAVGELTARLAARRGIAIELDVQAGDRLGEGARSALYQIVREALDQALRRGPPTRVSVSVTETPAGVELRVGDDGAQERRQAVLDGLAARAAELNGAFSSSTTETGTWIAVRLPPTAARR